MSWRQQYLERFYSGRSDWQNGTQQFYNMLRSQLASDAVVLELGPGPGNQTSKFLSEQCARVDGLDIDEEVKGNAFLQQRIVYEGSDFPLPDAQYDAVVADYVLEHIENPRQLLAEITRVLRPGGVFLFRTPNLYHYVSLISRCTPHSLHLLGVRFANGGMEAHDPYPTFYRLNTPGTLRRLCDKANLEPVELQMVEKEPTYLLFSRLAFFAGLAYERTVNSSQWLSPFRVNIFGACQRRTACQMNRTEARAA